VTNLGLICCPRKSLSDIYALLFIFNEHFLYFLNKLLFFRPSPLLLRNNSCNIQYSNIQNCQPKVLLLTSVLSLKGCWLVTLSFLFQLLLSDSDDCPKSQSK
jgi:hypothetical protein